MLRPGRILAALGLLVLTLLVVALGARADSGTSVEIAVEVRTSNGGAVSGVRLFVEPLAAAAELLQPAAAELSLAAASTIRAPGQARLALPTGESFRVRAEAEGWWAKPQVLKVGGVGQTLSITLFPAGQVRGRFVMPDDFEPPHTLALRFLPGDGGDGPRAIVECPVDQGRFQCPIPRGTQDLKVEVAGAVPHYFWSTAVGAQEVDLGSLVLRRGASLVGWVEIPARDFEVSQLEIELQPLTAAWLSEEERRQLDRLRLVTTIDEQGFFQLAGLASGHYQLVARHPDYAPAVLPELLVREGEETELDPLALPPPTRLRVVLDSPTDPFGRAWELTLNSASIEGGVLDVAGRGTADARGVLELAGLTPREHFLEVRDSRGGRWRAETLRVFPGENRLEIRVPFVRLEGRLRLDDEPVVGAQVELRQDLGNAQLLRQSDEEGRFFVFLPPQERWQVTVTDERGLHARFEGVEVPERRKGDRWPVRRFDLPSTRIEGEIVDASGQPVDHRVRIDVSGPDREGFGARSTDDGRFEILGLPPGTAWLQARAPGEEGASKQRSQMAVVDVAEDRTVGPVQLVLEPMFRVVGQVVAPSGEGVAGAKIVPRPTVGPGEPMPRFLASTRTDIEGGFELFVPRSNRRVRLMVLPPGFAVTQTVLELDPGAPPAPVWIPVSPISGTLVVSYESPPETLLPSLKLRTQVVGGSLLFGPLLAEWARSHGVRSPLDRAVIPALEPGQYRACFGAATGFLLDRGEALPSTLEASQCVRGELAPGGELELQIPARAMRQASSR